MKKWEEGKKFSEEKISEKGGKERGSKYEGKPGIDHLDREWGRDPSRESEREEGKRGSQ